jgi:hypothetical protein
LPAAWLSGIIWTGSQFVAVGGGNALTSPDGVNWTQHTMPNSANDIAWSGTQFVAVGNNGNGNIIVSADGINWLQQSKVDPFSDLYDIIWAGNKFVAVGGDVDTSYYTVLTSQ